MGGSPRYGLASVGVSPAVEAPWVMELYGGMREAADEYAMSLVGGDTSRAERMLVSVTVVGEVATNRAVTRGGARAGDRLVVTGSLGTAAGGLRLAREQPEEVKEILGTGWARSLLQALERPSARVGEGQALARAGATAMIDLSDGLALDLWRLCRESAVGATVRAEDIPVAHPLRELAAIEDLDPMELALHGGEDYELLATIPPAAVERVEADIGERFGTALTDIGEITEGSLVLEGPDGRQRPLEPRGWDHFAEG
jgi:thiamine-monophosphate kinase